MATFNTLGGQMKGTSSSSPPSPLLLLIILVLSLWNHLPSYLLDKLIFLKCTLNLVQLLCTSKFGEELKLVVCQSSFLVITKLKSTTISSMCICIVYVTCHAAKIN